MSPTTTEGPPPSSVAMFGDDCSIGAPLSGSTCDHCGVVAQAGLAAPACGASVTPDSPYSRPLTSRVAGARRNSSRPRPATPAPAPGRGPEHSAAGGPKPLIVPVPAPRDADPP